MACNSRLLGPDPGFVFLISVATSQMEARTFLTNFANMNVTSWLAGVCFVRTLKNLHMNMCNIAN